MQALVRRQVARPSPREISRQALPLQTPQRIARLIADAISDAGLRSDLVQTSLSRFERALEQGHGAKDMSASFLVD